MIRFISITRFMTIGLILSILHTVLSSGGVIASIIMWPVSCLVYMAIKMFADNTVKGESNTFALSIMIWYILPVIANFASHALQNSGHIEFGRILFSIRYALMWGTIILLLFAALNIGILVKTFCFIIGSSAKKNVVPNVPL